MSSAVLDVIVNSTAAVRALERIEDSLADIQRQTQKTERQVEGLGNSMKGAFAGIKGTIAGLAGAAGLGMIAGATLNSIRQFEALEAQLKTMMGSSEAAAESMKLISDYTKDTTFQLDDVAKSFIILQRTGLNPTKDSLNALGNVAAASNKSFEQLAEAVADAATGEYERLKEFGIKVAKEGDKLNVTFNNTTTTIKNSSDDIVRYLENIGKTKYADATAQQAKTLNGAISNLQDSFAQLAVSVGKGGLTAALNDVVRRMTEAANGSGDLATKIGEILGNAVRATADAVQFLVDNFEILLPVMAAVAASKVVLFFTELAGAVKLAGTAVRGLWAVIVANPIGLIVTAIAGVIAAIGTWVVQTIKAKNENASTMDVLKAMAKVIWEKVQPAIEAIKTAWTDLVEVLTVVGNAVKTFVNYVIGALVTLKDFVVYVVDVIYTGFSNTFSRIGDIAKAFGQSLVKLISDPLNAGSAFDPLFNTLEQEWSTGIVELSKSFGEKVSDNFNRDFVGEMGGAISDFAASMMEGVKGAVNGFGDEVSEELRREAFTAAMAAREASEGMGEIGKKADEVKPKVQQLSEEMRKFKESLEKRVQELQKEYDTMGMSAGQIEAYDMKMKVQNQTIDENVRKLMERVEALNAQVAEKTVAQNVNDMVEQIREETRQLTMNNMERAKRVNILNAENMAKREGRTLTDEQRKAIEDATVALESQKKAIEERKEFEEKAKEAALEAEKQRQEAIKKTQEATRRAAQDMAAAFNDFIWNTGEGWQGLVRSIIGGIAQIIAASVQSNSMMGNFVTGFLGGFRAQGGPVSSGTPYVVGEKGPELFVPNTAGRIVPNNQLSAGGSEFAGSGMHVTVGSITVGSGQDVDALVDQIAEGLVKGASIVYREQNRVRV